METQRRKEYIDVAKGVAITLVVMGHVLCYSFYNFHVDGSGLFSLIYFFHMPLFMFLSGLVVSALDKSICEIGTDCWKRVKSLLIPFFVFGGMYAYVHGSNIEELFCSNMKLGYWYLWTLFELYLLHYVVVGLCKLSSKWYMTILYGAVIYLFLHVTRSLVPSSLSEILSYKQVVNYFPYFYAGCLINRWNVSVYIFGNRWGAAFCLAGAPVLMYMAMNGILDTMPHVQKLVKWLVVFAVLYVVYNNNGAVVRSIFNNLGRNTLAIYVLHYFVLIVLDLTFVGDFIQVHYSIGLELVCSIMGTCIVLALTCALANLLQRSEIIRKYLFMK